MGFQLWIENIRWDIFSTLFLSIFFYIVLIFQRHKKNKKLKIKNKKPQDILVVSDFLYTILTSSTIYGGISAIYYSIKGKLLFNQNLIISQEYMIMFAGIVLVGLGIIVFKKTLKEIMGGKK